MNSPKINKQFQLRTFLNKNPVWFKTEYQKIKYLQINVAKEIKNLCSENYKNIKRGKRLSKQIERRPTFMD